MPNFNKSWKNFLFEDTFKEKKPQENTRLRIKLENNERLLKEITEDELEHIQRAIEEIPPEDLAFNQLFDGKARLIIDFPVIDTGSELGKFVELWEKMNYTVDWKKGIISADLFYVDQSPAAQADRIVSGELGPGKPRKIKMKIGKWLSKVHEYATKLAPLGEKIRATDPSRFHPRGAGPAPWVGRITGNDVVKALGEDTAEHDAYYRLLSHLDMLIPVSPMLLDIMTATALKRIPATSAKWIRYWQENADYIKNNIDKTTTNQYSIIITRDPIDILRMSDFDDISSCHSPPSRGGEGQYYKCAVAEAHGHGAVAYVVKTENLMENFEEELSLEQIADTHEFQHDEIFVDEARGLFVDGWIEPVSRIRLRQVRFYKNKEKPERHEGRNPYEGTQLAIPERRIYGALIPGFRNRIMRWVRENQSEQLRIAPRSPNHSNKSHGEKPWEFGTIDLNSFTKFGGSHEDTSISVLITDLFGKNVPKVGFPVQDTETQDALDANLVGGLLERYAIECEETSDHFNGMMAACSVEGTPVDDGDGGVYITCEAAMIVRWPEHEWKTWPNIELVGWALEELNTYGISWVKSDYPNQMNRGPDTRVFAIDIAPERLVAFGQEYAYDPDNYHEFCTSVDVEADDKRDAVKLLLTNFFKREGAMKGGGVMRLGHDVINDNMDLYSWEAEAEEGYEIDEFEIVSFTAHPEVFYADLGATEEEAAQIFADRNYWLEIRKRMAAPAFENTGYSMYPQLCLDCDLIGSHGTPDESEELNLILSVHDDAPDDQAEVLRNLVEIWDDQDEINRVANEVFRDMTQGELKRSEMKVGPSPSEMAEELNALRIERMLRRLNI